MQYLVVLEPSAKEISDNILQIINEAYWTFQPYFLFFKLFYNFF